MDVERWFSGQYESWLMAMAVAHYRAKNAIEANVADAQDKKRKKK